LVQQQNEHQVSTSTILIGTRSITSGSKHLMLDDKEIQSRASRTKLLIVNSKQETTPPESKHLVTEAMPLMIYNP